MKEVLFYLGCFYGLLIGVFIGLVWASHMF